MNTLLVGTTLHQIVGKGFDLLILVICYDNSTHSIGACNTGRKQQAGRCFAVTIWVQSTRAVTCWKSWRHLFLFFNNFHIKCYAFNLCNIVCDSATV